MIFSIAIQIYREAEGFSVVRRIYRSWHRIRYGWGGTAGSAPLARPAEVQGSKEGMVLTIEPMLNVGAWKSKLDSDGWTARTIDGKLSAQYEHTLAITEDGPLILTKL